MLDLRIKQKKDTEANWISANPILLDGELVLVETSKRVRIKVGDGSSRYSELPFVDSDIFDTVSVLAGGTGLNSLTPDRYLVGNGTDKVTLKTPTEVRDHIGAAPYSHEHSFVRDRVVVDEDGTVSISIPSTVSSDGQSDSNYLLVYQNGLLLERDIHYTHDTKTTISLVDTSAKSGDIFSFLRVNTPVLG